MGLRNAWYRLETLLARILVRILVRLPLGCSLAVARGVGWTVFWAWPSRRRVAVDNCLETGLVRDRASARRLALRSFESFVVMVVETIVARERLRGDRWEDAVELRMSDEARRVLEQPGLGLIVASAHLGNWEVAARAVSRIKPLCVVYRPVKNPLLNAYLHAGRSGERLRYLSRLESDPRRFLLALSQGEMVALMVDQHVYSGRVPVRFFGRTAWTSKATAMLHFTTRAPLLVAVAVREGPLKYAVHAVGPIVGERTGDRDADATRLLQRVTDEVEALIRQTPEQYLWGHRRWKESPVAGDGADPAGLLQVDGRTNGAHDPAGKEQEEER
jgi:KDO2-lipid IV(A) lauroyltransferase